MFRNFSHRKSEDEAFQAFEEGRKKLAEKESGRIQALMDLAASLKMTRVGGSKNNYTNPGLFHQLKGLAFDSCS